MRRGYEKLELNEEEIYRIVTPKEIGFLEEAKMGVVLAKIPNSQKKLEKIINGIKEGNLTRKQLKELQKDYFVNNFEYDASGTSLTELLLLSNDCNVTSPKNRNQSSNEKQFLFFIPYSNGHFNYLDAKDSQGVSMFAKFSESPIMYAPNSKSPVFFARKSMKPKVDVTNSSNPWIDVQKSKEPLIIARNSKNPVIISNYSRRLGLDVTRAENKNLYLPTPEYNPNVTH